LLWVLNQSDGTQSLLDIAERSGLDFDTIQAAASDLASCGLLVSADESAARLAE
jgi:aminopeptidase-like protein